MTAIEGVPNVLYPAEVSKQSGTAQRNTAQHIKGRYLHRDDLLLSCIHSICVKRLQQIPRLIKILPQLGDGLVSVHERGDLGAGQAADVYVNGAGDLLDLALEGPLVRGQTCVQEGGVGIEAFLLGVFFGFGEEVVGDFDGFGEGWDHGGVEVEGCHC